MPMTALDIYKVLPQTNCGDCGVPTCLAFAMQLATKKAGIDDCPHATDEATGEIRQDVAKHVFCYQHVKLPRPSNQIEGLCIDVVIRPFDVGKRGRALIEDLADSLDFQVVIA